MPAVEELPRRRRVARLGWLTLALTGVCLALLGIAVSMELTGRPTHDVVGRLPIAARDSFPSVPFILAVGAAVAGAFVGLAALHTAAAMRVLARDRRIPPPLSPEMRRVRASVLAPLGHSAARLVAPPAIA